MTDFDEFVRRNATSLHATAWLICGDVEDARDLVQSGLLVLFRRWSRLSQDNLRGYVVTVMANEHRRTLRSQWRRQNAERRATTDDWYEPPASEGLLGYLDALGPRQRAAVVLRVVEDLPEVEVARLLGCSVGTVKSQTSRALAAMRERVAAEATVEG